MKKLYATLSIVLVFLSTSLASADSCVVELKDTANDVHMVAEACENIGTFSIGGVYNREWEKLTYLYPKPWPGTFLSIKLGDKVYSTSSHPKDAILLDPYAEKKPSVVGDKITALWVLPENVTLVQSLKSIKNGTSIEITVANQNTYTIDAGIRLHLDTMLGINDGAPIYVPGDGLKTIEESYSGTELNFKYWKAYNTQDNPTIVATGTMDPALGLTYPDRVIIADWKKSKDTAWDYSPSGGSILGDSAVILYYNITLGAGESKAVKLDYGSREAVLPKGKGPFGVTEVLVDNVYGTYCPNDTVSFTIDVLSARVSNRGKVNLLVQKEGSVLFNKTLDVGLVQPDSVKSLSVEWVVPDISVRSEYDVRVLLLNESNDVVESLNKTSLIKVDPARCFASARKFSWWWLLFMILLLLFLLTLAVPALLIYLKGGVLLTKEINAEGLVIVRVSNKTRKALTSCVLEDGIPTKAEIDVSTLGVTRRADKLVWKIGVLVAGDEATLEYKIHGVNVLPPAQFLWNDSKVISSQ